MRSLRSTAVFGGCLWMVGCAQPVQHSGEAPAADQALDEVELAPAPRARSFVPSYVRLARVEGYGNPKTGELWMRAVPLVEGITGFESGGAEALQARAPEGVAVSAQAAMLAGGRVSGFCEANYEADGVPNNNPNGTLEFYNQYDATGNAADQSSFDVATCYGRLPAQDQTPLVSSLFTTQGVGCAHQHVGNFSGKNYNRLLLDVDVFNGSLASHGPYGPPFTTGTVTTPEGRNAPYQDLGLWDFGALPSGTQGQTSGPHLKNMWVYFKNSDANDFNWTGYILGEVFEECGDDDDDDCDGEHDNGCAMFTDGSDCFSDTDCVSGSCEGASVVSGQGEGGGELTDDVEGVCGVVAMRIDAGANTSCWVQSGYIACWGDDTTGLVSEVPLDSGYAKVAVGDGHACALRTDGSLVCWGVDGLGGLPTPPMGSDYIDVAAGGGHSCALSVTGSVTCWGSNTSGQVNAQSASDFVQVAAGSNFSCALRRNGSIQCWGSTADGRTTPPTQQVFTHITLGGAHGCALSAAGYSTCWGQGVDGQTDAQGDVMFVDLAAGTSHNCGIQMDGSLWCWGLDTYGQATPPVGTGYEAVSSGASHSCAVKAGMVECWGDESDGQTVLPGTIVPIILGNTNESFATAQAVGGAPLGYSGNTSAMSSDMSAALFNQAPTNGGAVCSAGASSADAYFTFTLASPSGIEIKAASASFDHTLALFDTRPLTLPSAISSNSDSIVLAQANTLGAIDGNWKVVTATMSDKTIHGLTQQSTAATNTDGIQALGDPNGKQIVVTGATTAGRTADYPATDACGAVNSAPDAMYSFVPTASTTMRVQANNPTPGFSLGLGVYNGTVGDPLTLAETAPTMMVASANDMFGTAYNAGVITAPGKAITGNATVLTRQVTAAHFNQESMYGGTVCNAHASNPDAFVSFTIVSVTTVQISTVGTSFGHTVALWAQGALPPSTPGSLQCADGTAGAGTTFMKTLAPGTYYVGITSQVGQATGAYQITLTDPSAALIGATPIQCSASSAIDVSVTAGTTYYVIVKGVSGGASGTYGLRLTDIGALTPVVSGCGVDQAAPDAFFAFDVLDASGREVEVGFNGSSLSGALQVRRISDSVAIGSCTTSVSTYSLAQGSYYVAVKGLSTAAGQAELPTRLSIHDVSAFGALDCSDGTSTTPASLAGFLNPGTYYVGIRGQGAQAGDYELHFLEQ